MNIADKIIKMSKYLTPTEIAKAIELPEEVVEGVLSGTIAEDILDEFNPSKPPEIRIVEQKRFLRSLVVGIVSIGGAGATNLTASLATLEAIKGGSQTIVIDLNEFSSLGSNIGIPYDKSRGLPNICGWGLGADIGECITRHNKIDGLEIILGASNLSTYSKISINRMKECISELGRRYESVWVDCPTSPLMWSKLIDDLDILCILIKPESNSIAAIEQASSIKDIDKDKVFVIIRGDKDRGYMNLNECSRAIKNLTGLSVIGVLPREPSIRNYNNNEENFVLKNMKSEYTGAVKGILSKIKPDNKSKDKQSDRKKRGFLSW